MRVSTWIWCCLTYRSFQFFSFGKVFHLAKCLISSESFRDLNESTCRRDWFAPELLGE